MGLVAVGAFVPGGISGFQGTSKELFYAFALILAMANSAINPIIYYLKHPGFREKLKKMFSSKRKITPASLSGSED